MANVYVVTVYVDTNINNEYDDRIYATKESAKVRLHELAQRYIANVPKSDYTLEDFGDELSIVLPEGQVLIWYDRYQVFD